jgi:hypothetical protein
LSRILFPIILVATISLLSAPSLISAEIKLTPPTNWQAAPTNNSTAMMWFQNNTKSVFAIIKAPFTMKLPMLPLLAPFVSQIIANEGVLESVDETSFGRSNNGYRYFLNISSPSKLLNSSDNLVSSFGFLPDIPKEADVTFRGMLILTQKQDNFYAIAFLSPKENFDSVLNEIKPTLDSIQLGNTAANQTLLG